jgi:hypothetical protein
MNLKDIKIHISLYHFQHKFTAYMDILIRIIWCKDQRNIQLNNPKEPNILVLLEFRKFSLGIYVHIAVYCCQHTKMVNSDILRHICE